MASSLENVTSKTIEDFGAQWTRFPDNSGYYASKEYLEDICRPLLPPDFFKGKVVREIGSGSGRIVNMLLDAGAAHVHAVEPSKAMESLKLNTRERSDSITYISARGDDSKAIKVDAIISIGVIHHIPSPEPVVRAAYECLKPGGVFLIWVYGIENNEAFVFCISALRAFTCYMPDRLLSALSHILCGLLSVFALFGKVFKLPSGDYLTNVFLKLTWRQRALVIFDQLNPAHAKYYREKDVKTLLSAAPFRDIKTHHRHNYSWTAVGLRED